jgi:hypothetical protein
MTSSDQPAGFENPTGGPLTALATTSFGTVALTVPGAR